jgi:hypothetical protein
VAWLLATRRLPRAGQESLAISPGAGAGSVPQAGDDAPGTHWYGDAGVEPLRLILPLQGQVAT